MKPVPPSPDPALPPQSTIGGLLVEFRKKHGDSSPRKASPEILLIDDDDMDMVLMKRAANRIGWKVFEARSGNAGLEIYKSKMSDPYWMSGCSPHPFDMVFLDLKLGDIPGPDVFAAIKSLHRGQPVAIVSAYASQYDLNAMAKTGYVGLIVKPFTIENLEEVLAVHNLPLRVEN